MKKTLFIFTIMLMTAAMLSNIALAQKFYGISSPDYATAGDYMEVHTNVQNTYTKNIPDAKVVVFVPNADIYEKSSPFYLSKNMNYGRFMHVYVPEGTPAGEYDMRISLFHNGKMQHQWRTITVE